MTSLCNLATTLRRLTPDNMVCFLRFNHTMTLINLYFQLEASDLYRQFLALCRNKDAPRTIVLNYQIQAFYELAKCLQGTKLLERAIFAVEKVCALAADG
jgi:hypothetical protein